MMKYILETHQLAPKQVGGFCLRLKQLEYNSSILFWFATRNSKMWRKIVRAPLVDCHTHTFYSDGESSFEENVRAAAAAGCRVLVSTDHLTLPASMDPNCECQVPARDLQAHRAAFEAARRLAGQIAPDMDFIFGFECDWYPGCEANVAAWAQNAQVKLGSVHWVGPAGDVSVAAGAAGCDAIAPADAPGASAGWIDYSEDMHIWEELGAEGVWRAYVDAWCAACESPLAFDSMAHPDLPMRFSQDGWPAPRGVEALWDEMAACAHDTGRRIELSTASLRKGMPDYYPAAGLFGRFRKAEVPITLGSDAHIASDVCWGIAEAQRHAYEAGYRNFDVPRAGGNWESWGL